MAILLLLFWIPLCVAVAVAAKERGRDGPTWFFASLFFSPLLAVLLLIALPDRRPIRPTDGGFQPDDVICGVPCRFRTDGKIDAMMSGGLVHFATVDQFIAAVPAAIGMANALRDKIKKTKAVIAGYPEVENGYHYKSHRDGSVEAIAPDGSLIKFGNWKDFWKEVSRAQ